MKSKRCAHPRGEIWTPLADSGAYQLVIGLRRTKKIRVGALRAFEFPAGAYVYTGRASRNLRSRVGRHLRCEKTLRWHIDYLLRWAVIEEVRVFPGRADEECSINLETARCNGYAFLVPGFGSSDCGCPAHLLWTGHDRQGKPRSAEEEKFRQESRI